MNIVDKRIADLVPAHYREYAPRFITFLEKYYEWLYRTSGLSQSEVTDLKNDTSWLEQDIDRFIATGKLRYLDPAASASLVDDAIIDLNSTENPGIHADKLPDDFTMENNFNGYTTTEGDAFTDNNDTAVELSTVENTILDGWFNSMGFDRIKRSRLKALNNIDQVLMLSLLKHIYSIKGTEASIKLFFNLFFGEDVVVYKPKLDISVIDENWALDSTQVLRDDELFQEYSYVIVVLDDPQTYLDIMQTIYLKTIHPSGFRVALTQYNPTITGLPLETGGYLLVKDGVYLDLSSS